MDTCFRSLDLVDVVELDGAPSVVDVPLAEPALLHGDPEHGPVLVVLDQLHARLRHFVRAAKTVPSQLFAVSGANSLKKV